MLNRIESMPKAIIIPPRKNPPIPINPNDNPTRKNPPERNGEIIPDKKAPPRRVPAS